MINAPVVTIFGGSGFVGRYVAQRMARAGWRVRVAVRRPNDAIFVKTYGVVGQVEPVQANIRDDASTRAAIAGASAVVNCVGLLYEDGWQKFDAVHRDAASRMARISAAEGVAQFVHISAIGANPDAKSDYARSKGEGEAEIRQAFPTAAILRPSIIFGNEDQFFNRFAKMARISPVLPLVGADTRFQPVYVGNVAEAVENAITQQASGVFELGGPEIASFRELIQRMLRVVRRRKLIVNLPTVIARINAGLLSSVEFLSGGLIPNRMITADQITQLADDNIAYPDARGLADLGVTPTQMDAVLESYLYCYRPQGEFTALTESARDIRG